MLVVLWLSLPLENVTESVFAYPQVCRKLIALDAHSVSVVCAMIRGDSANIAPLAKKRMLASRIVRTGLPIVQVSFTSAAGTRKRGTRPSRQRGVAYLFDKSKNFLRHAGDFRV